jgi:TRAP-type C4-dicarboxylate transport system permease small subunit
VLDRLEASAAPLTRWMAVAGLVCFVAVAMATIVDVLLRWLLNSPIDGVEEVTRLAVAVAIASFFPLALAERHHIAITFLGSVLGARARAWLESFAALVTSWFFFVAGWQFVLYTEQVEEAGETTWILGWTVTPWWAAVTAFMLVCVPVQLLVALGEIARAARGAARPAGGGG